MLFAITRNNSNHRRPNVSSGQPEASADGWLVGWLVGWPLKRQAGDFGDVAATQNTVRRFHTKGEGRLAINSTIHIDHARLAAFDARRPMVRQSFRLVPGHREIFGLSISVAERLSYVGESLRDSLNPKIESCRRTRASRRRLSLSCQQPLVAQLA